MKIPKVCVLATWMVVTAVLGSGAQAVRAPDDLAGVAKVDLAVIRAMAQRGEASYIVYLREQADLSSAHGMTDRTARGRYRQL